MRQIKRIIIHCTATPEGRDHTAKEIDRWHKAQGWSGIGYHYVIRLDGTVENGRPVEKVGAHVKGHNADSIGVVYVGGCDTSMKAKDTRTPAQKAALVKLVADIQKRYPNTTVHGHNEFDKQKACPSFDVRKEW